MVTARTFSGPNARAARNVTTLESMPPESPTTARSKPGPANLRADEAVENVRDQFGVDGQIVGSSLPYRFRLMRLSSSIVSSSRSSRAKGVISRWRRRSAASNVAKRQRFVEHRRLGDRAAVRPDHRASAPEAQPVLEADAVDDDHHRAHQLRNRPSRDARRSRPCGSCGPSTPRPGEFDGQTSRSISSACMMAAAERCQKSSQIRMPIRPKRAVSKAGEALAGGEVALLVEQAVGRQIDLAVQVDDAAAFGI